MSWNGDDSTESVKLEKKKKKWWPGKYDNVDSDKPKRLTPSEALRQEVALLQENRQAILHSLYNNPPSCDVESEAETVLPFNKNFLVVHFGTYSQPTLQTMIPAEFCVGVFSIRDGLQQCYSRMVDPGPIPLGLGLAFRESMQVGKYQLPPFDPEFDFVKDLVKPLEALMKQYPSNSAKGGPAFLYTYYTDLEIVNMCLRYICETTGHQLNYKVMSLPILLETLLNEADHLRQLNGYKPVVGNGVVEAQAIGILRNLNYEYIPELGCKYHQEEDYRDGLPYCSMSLVKRWIYNLLPVACRFYKCQPYLHNHIPDYANPEEVTEEAVEGSCSQDTLDQKLPAGITMHTKYEFIRDNYDTDLTKTNTELSNSGVSSEAELTDQLKHDTDTEKGYGTHHIFPNLLDFKECFPQEARSISVTNIPGGGSVKVYASPKIKTIPGPRSGKEASSSEAAGGRPEAGGISSSVASVPWSPRKIPLPGDPMEVKFPMLELGLPVPLDKDEARIHRARENARYIKPTSIVEGSGTMFWDTASERSSIPGYVPGRGRGAFLENKRIVDGLKLQIDPLPLHIAQAISKKDTRLETHYPGILTLSREKAEEMGFKRVKEYCEKFAKEHMSERSDTLTASTLQSGVLSPHSDSVYSSVSNTRGGPMPAWDPEKPR